MGLRRQEKMPCSLSPVPPSPASTPALLICPRPLGETELARHCAGLLEHLPWKATGGQEHLWHGPSWGQRGCPWVPLLLLKQAGTQEGFMPTHPADPAWNKQIRAPLPLSQWGQQLHQEGSDDKRAGFVHPVSVTVGDTGAGTATNGRG